MIDTRRENKTRSARQFPMMLERTTLFMATILTAIGCSADRVVNNPGVTQLPDSTTATFTRDSAQAFIYMPGEGMKAIPNLPGATQSWATGINDSGVVVGYSQIAGSQHGFIWSKSKGSADIGSLVSGAGFVRATAVNLNGQVTGWSVTANGSRHAFRWTSAGGMVDLGLPADGVHGEGLGINAAGDVVGDIQDIDGRVRPFRWNGQGGMVSLAPASDSVAVYATGINNAGGTSGTSLVVGGSYEGNAIGAMAWLGAPGSGLIDIAACETFDCLGEATAINQDADIVGESNDRAYRWSYFSGLTILAPGTPSLATGVNDNDQVCGSERVDRGEVAVIWTGSSLPLSLGALKGQTFSRATGINNKGQAVGYSY